MRIEARITPEVLLWARERAGYEVDDVVEELGLKSVTHEVVSAWEKNESHLNDIPLTYSQLEKLAKMYKRPLAVFFFPKPPEETSISQQLRSLPQSHAQQLSPKMLYLIRTALAKQMDLYDIHGGNFPNEIQNFRRDIDNVNRETAKTLAAKMRQIIGISLEEQKSWKAHDIALKKWRKKLEELGIWIFKGSFKDDEYCGFYLPDPDKQFPIIYLNNNMPQPRQIFTLFHELGHFLRDKGGVDFRKNVENKFKNIYQEDEIFCNAFAGSFLVPDDSLPIPSRPLDDEEIESYTTRYSNEYSVSREVILRKLLNNELIKPTQYNSKVKQWRGIFEKLRKEAREQKKGGGDYYRTKKTYIGDKYLNLLFQQYYQQRINEHQLAGYLGSNVSGVHRFEELILRGDTQ